MLSRHPAPSVASPAVMLQPGEQSTFPVSNIVVRLRSHTLKRGIVATARTELAGPVLKSRVHMLPPPWRIN